MPAHIGCFFSITVPLGCRLLVYLCRVLKQTNKRFFWGGLTGDLLSLGTVQALGALLPLATVPHLLRVVGLESFGWYNLSLALMNFGVAWVDYGFTLTGSRDKSAVDAHQATLDAHQTTTDAHQTTAGAHQTTTDAHQAGLRETGQKQSNASQLLFSRYFFTQLLLLGIGLPVLVLLVMGIPSWRANASFFFFSALLLPAQIFMPAWWLQGSRQFALLARWQVLGRLLFALGVFVLIDSPDDQLLLPLLNGGCMLLVSIAAFFQVISTHKISLQWPGLASCRALLRVNRPVFVGGLSSAFYAHSTLIVLELFAGVRWVGLISTLEKIMLVFRMAANSFQQV
ncbi:MAG: oligosaccharide flippase family protein, partial [Bacteroidota bacterium]